MNEQPKPPAESYPLESFNHKLLTVLIQGSKERFEVSNITYRQAVHFRHRCHMLRSRMRRENHPLYKVVSKTKLRIEWDRSKVKTLVNRRRIAYPEDSSAPATLVISPFDEEIGPALEAAGFDFKHPTTLDGTPTPPTDGDEPAPSLEKLLGDL